MARARKTESEQEPVGIVISRGSREENPPQVSAYVWGPVPSDVETTESMVAA